MGLRLEAIKESRLSWLAFEPIGDDRGWLAEVFNQARATELRLPLFSQDNASFSGPAGLVRGLHYQRPPFAQAKLLRVVRGSIFHVAVDLCAAAPRAHAFEILAGEPRWLYLPSGFAHGFQTLCDDTEISWKLSSSFRPDHAGTVAFDDPDLGVLWPRPVHRSRLSPRDRAAESLRAALAAYADGG